MKFAKGGPEWAMFGDLYKLSERFWEVQRPDNEKYWFDLVEAASEFLQKYEGIPYAKGACLALLTTLEEQARQIT